MSNNSLALKFLAFPGAMLAAGKALITKGAQAQALCQKETLKFEEARMDGNEDLVKNIRREYLSCTYKMFHGVK
ncbi:unnamed protein product [Blepharisma stoltei]|uniref:Uncharacterized protein n=1 Tax=Blepharisma stoltei TaxID=1481888 RepID=A0AAU9K5A4_9CILI|nr:unnamed protein product [Blepharisma stoltei]